MSRAPAVVLLLASVLCAQHRVLPYPVTEPAAYRAAIAAATRSESGSPGPNAWDDRVHYLIRASLDPATAVVRGHVEARYDNRSRAPLNELWLHLRQNLHRGSQMRTRSCCLTLKLALVGCSLRVTPPPSMAFCNSEREKSGYIWCKY